MNADVLILDGGGFGAVALQKECERHGLSVLVVNTGESSDLPVYEAYETEAMGRIAAATFLAKRGEKPAFLAWDEQTKAAGVKVEECFTWNPADGEAYPFGAGSESLMKIPRKQGRRFMPCLRGFGPQRADNLTSVVLDDGSHVTARFAFQTGTAAPSVKVATFAALSLNGFSSIESNFRLFDRFGNSWYLLGEAGGGVVCTWWLCGPPAGDVARPLDDNTLLAFIEGIGKYHGIELNASGPWRYITQPEHSAVIASESELQATGVHGWLQAYGRGAINYARFAAMFMVESILKNGADSARPDFLELGR